MLHIVIFLKRPGSEADRSPPCRAALNYDWSYTSTLPGVSMAYVMKILPLLIYGIGFTDLEELKTNDQDLYKNVTKNLIFINGCSLSLPEPYAFEPREG
jgi:hypothetical protein